ncbi:MAG: hypothetical protein NZ902_05335 [Acidilobaceae archaeon]|nr:hypothetical protein [Acidilobaceae archaeon]
MTVAVLLGAYFALLDRSPHDIEFFLISLLISLPLLSVSYLLRNSPPLEVRDAFLVISLYWLLLPALSGVVLSITLDLSLVDGFFESLSAMSGAGFSFINPDNAPPVVLLWRTALQWLGGISIVVIGGAFLPLFHSIVRSLYVVEVGAKLAPTIISTVRTVFLLYLFLSLLSITIFLLAGMDLFDALNNGLTAIATGGMSTKANSFYYWYERGQSEILVAAMIIMIIGATNFSDLYSLLTGNFSSFFRSPEVKSMALLLLILLPLGALGTEDVLPALFNVVSAITTTGFQAGDISSQSDEYKILLIVAMMIGGATFSTAAGLKLKRVIVAAKALYFELSRPLAPAGVVRTLRVGDKELGESDVSSVLSYMFLYALTLLISSALLKLVLDLYGDSDHDYLDVLFETTSALSCVGLSVGIISPELPLVAKLLIAFIIYVGRIEFIALYLLVGTYQRRKTTL